MELESIRLTDVIPVTPARLYDAWMDAVAHSAMTGSPATIEPSVGGNFTAWEGYISGVNDALVPGEKIVQRWRAQDFPVDAEHSKLVVTFAPDEGGTLVTIEHSELPKGMGEGFLKGWDEFYFKPMKKHFKKAATVKKAAPVKKTAPAKKAVAKKAAPAKKAAAKKAVAKKAVAKKPAAKRAVAKKPAAKKAAAKKPAAKLGDEDPPAPTPAPAGAKLGDDDK